MSINIEQEFPFIVESCYLIKGGTILGIKGISHGAFIKSAHCFLKPGSRVSVSCDSDTVDIGGAHYHMVNSISTINEKKKVVYKFDLINSSWKPEWNIKS